MINGFVVVDKPSGVTSHDVVSMMRRIFKMRRVGHAGTLDPLATGVLVMLLGTSTKLFKKFSSFSKAYQATITLGLTTDTADTNGTVISQKPYDTVTRAMVEKVLQQFVGDIEQVPPMVSAIKVNGTRLYKLARQGVQVKREPRTVTIATLKLTDFNPPHVGCYVECSKGTYIRKLAEDVGELLGCGACISQIRRTAVGPFTIDRAVAPDKASITDVQQWTQ